MTSGDLREKVIKATFELAAETPILAISLSDIADRAGISLAELNASYVSRIAILEDFARLIDERVLADGLAEATEQPRERLLDVMMRRFDALAAFRPGLKGIRKAAMRDPAFAATLNHIAVGSQKWMLAAAHLDPIGPFAPLRRLARAEALVLVTASVLPVFLDDRDEGLPKTMAALDSALQRLDRVAQVVTRMEAMVDRVCAKGPRWKRTPKSTKSDARADSSAAQEAVSPKPSGVYVKGEDNLGDGGSGDGEPPTI